MSAVQFDFISADVLPFPFRIIAWARWIQTGSIQFRDRLGRRMWGIVVEHDIVIRQLGVWLARVEAHPGQFLHAASSAPAASVSGIAGRSRRRSRSSCRTTGSSRPGSSRPSWGRGTWGECRWGRTRSWWVAPRESVGPRDHSLRTKQTSMKRVLHTRYMTQFIVTCIPSFMLLCKFSSRANATLVYLYTLPLDVIYSWLSWSKWATSEWLKSLIRMHGQGNKFNLSGSWVIHEWFMSDSWNMRQWIFIGMSDSWVRTWVIREWFMSDSWVIHWVIHEWFVNPPIREWFVRDLRMIREWLESDFWMIREQFVNDS